MDNSAAAKAARKAEKAARNKKGYIAIIDSALQELEDNAHLEQIMTIVHTYWTFEHSRKMEAQSHE